MDDRQIECLQRMTPAQRLHVALRLYVSARRLKAAMLRSLHPDWSDAQVERAVREVFLYARS